MLEPGGDKPGGSPRWWRPAATELRLFWTAAGSAAPRRFWSARKRCCQFEHLRLPESCRSSGKHYDRQHDSIFHVFLTYFLRIVWNGCLCRGSLECGTGNRGLRTGTPADGGPSESVGLSRQRCTSTASLMNAFHGRNGGGPRLETGTARSATCRVRSLMWAK